jgi:hypothetical protein
LDNLAAGAAGKVIKTPRGEFLIILILLPGRSAALRAAAGEGTGAPGESPPGTLPAFPAANSHHREGGRMDSHTLILILVILLVLGAFGGVGRRYWR